MLDTQAQQDERQGDARQASDLVWRDTGSDGSGAFPATAGTDGGALLVNPR